MLPRLFQRPLWPRTFPSITRHPFPHLPKYPAFLASRLFSRSPRFHQNYRYRRFNDLDYPSIPGGGSNGGSGRGFGVFSIYPQLFGVVCIGGGGVAFYVSHLETVPETGRRRFIFMSKSMEEALGNAVPSP